jgi:hypothetical protein
MRRLEHLPGIERMEIGVIVPQSAGHFREDFLHAACIDDRLKCRQSGKLRLKQLSGSGKQCGNRIEGHVDPPHYHNRNTFHRPVSVIVSENGNRGMRYLAQILDQDFRMNATLCPAFEPKRA